MQVVTILVILLTCASSQNRNINTLYATLQKQRGIVEAMENREFLTILIQLIELKYEIDPPPNYSRLQLYLLLTRQILSDIRFFINRTLRTVQHLMEVREEIQIKRVSQFRSLLYVIKGITHFVDKWTDILLNVTEPLTHTKNQTEHTKKTTTKPLATYYQDIPNATIVLHSLNDLSNKVLDLENLEQNFTNGNESTIEPFVNGFFNVANNAVKGYLQTLNETDSESDEDIDAAVGVGDYVEDTSEATSESSSQLPLMGYPIHLIGD